MTVKHTCDPRPNGLGLFHVELEPVSTVGRRIGMLGPYKSTWNNGCEACMIWKICKKTEHLIAEYDEMGTQWLSKQGMHWLRQKSIRDGKGWLAVAFQGFDDQYVLTEKGLGAAPKDSVKAVMNVVANGQSYEIARITTSRSWQEPEHAVKYAIIKLPVESYSEGRALMDEAGFSNGFARASLTVEQIEWQLREAFDPGIDLA